VLALAAALGPGEPGASGDCCRQAALAAASRCRSCRWAAFRARGAGAAFLYWNLDYNFAYTANSIVASEALERAAAYLVPWLLAVSPLGSRRGARGARGRAVISISARSWGLLAASLGVAAWDCVSTRTTSCRLSAAGAAPRRVAAEALSRRWRAPACVAGATALMWLASAPSMPGSTTVRRCTPRPRLERVVVPSFRTILRRRGGRSCGVTRRLLLLVGLRPPPLRAGRSRALGLRPATRPPLATTRAHASASVRTTGMADERPRAQPSGVHPRHRARTRAALEQLPITRFPRLLGFVRERYAYAARLAGVDIWRRRDCPTAR